MKLDSPTIYVLHKVDGVLAKSAFSFTGMVDKRRIKREIAKAFRRGGETVNPVFLDACIDASLRAAEASRIVVSSEPVSIQDAEDAQLADRAAAEQRQHLKDEALERAIAGFEQQAKENYEVSKEIQERDARKTKA